MISEKVISEKLIGIMEDISRTLKKLETSGHQKQQYNNKQQTTRRRDRTTKKKKKFPNSNARPFTPHMDANNNSNENNEQNVVTTKVPNPCSPALPPNSPQTGTAQPTATDDALICSYHQRFGDKAHLCRDPCAFALNCLNQRKVATLAPAEPNETTVPKLSPSRLLYVADKRNKCRYSIDTGAAVSVLPRSYANGTVDADSLPLVAANNSTITTYGASKCIVDFGLKRKYSWTFIVADVKQPILGADFLIHYNLLVDLSGRCLHDMGSRLAIPATLSSIKPLPLNRIDSTRNEYTEILNQFPELTLPTYLQ